MGDTVVKLSPDFGAPDGTLAVADRILRAAAGPSRADLLAAAKTAGAMAMSPR